MQAGHLISNDAVDYNKSETYRSKSTQNELEPITLSSVELDGLKLSFSTPLTFYPQNDESGKYLTVEDDDFALFVFAQDRKELEKELNDEFVLMWKAYVTEEDVKLTQGATKLRQILKDNLIEEGVSSNAL